MAVNLDALFQLAGEVTVDGKGYTVHPLDCVGYEMYEALAENPAGTKVSDLYKIAARCCPDLPVERLHRMTPPQIGALLKVATGQVEAAEAEVAAVLGKSPATPAAPSST